MQEAEWEAPTAVLIDTDVASQLQRLVRMPNQQRCFHSDKLIYSVEGCAVVVRQFDNVWSSPRISCFHLPDKVDHLTVDTVKIAEFRHAGLLMVGCGSMLYCWSLAQPARLLFEYELVPGEQLLQFSDAYISSERSALLCCRTRQSTCYLIEVRWLDRLSYPKVTPLREQQSLFRSMGKMMSSLWTSTKNTNRSIDKCFVLAARNQEVECIVVQNDLVRKFVVDLQKQPRQAVCVSQSDFLSRLPEVRPDRIVGLWAHINTYTSPIARLVFYIASVNFNDELQLTKASRALDLSSIVNCLDETVNLQVSRFSNLEFYVSDGQWLHLVVYNNNNQSLVLKLSQNRMVSDQQYTREGKIVIIRNYQLSETGITNLRAEESVQQAQEERNESYYAATNKRLLEATPQLTAAISTYTDNYANPVDMLEALDSKNKQLEQQIAELRRHNLEGLTTELLLEKLKLWLQILIARNLKELHPVVLEAAREEFASKPMKLFASTSGLQPLLESLAKSGSWPFYILVLQSVLSFRAKYTGSSEIYESIMQLIMQPLKHLAQAMKVVNEIDRQRIRKLYSMAIQLNPKEPIFYEMLLRAGKTQECIDLARSNHHWAILPKLYASATQTISQHDIYSIISVLSPTQRQEVIVGIAAYYIDFLANKMRSPHPEPTRIKAFEDFPEYNEVIYQRIKQHHPRFAWLLAMKLRKPTSEYAAAMSASLNKVNSRSSQDVMNLIIHSGKPQPKASASKPPIQLD